MYVYSMTVVLAKLTLLTYRADIFLAGNEPSFQVGRDTVRRGMLKDLTGRTDSHWIPLRKPTLAFGRPCP